MMVMSFEVRDNSEELEIVLDSKGLKSLLDYLSFLDKQTTDHVHLMAKSWGGDELDEEPQLEGSKPMRHVKITFLGEDI